MIVGGGIAAYKACELIRLIRKAGDSVTCVLTDGGAQFITPMTLAALSENPVYTTLWDLKNESEMGHIQLSRQADLVVVCPATADLLAKMTAGIADDLATTLLLATDKRVLAVPAMNVRMWQHQATRRNVSWLRQSGVTVMEPDDGAMACGEFGPGRLPEPERIWQAIQTMLNNDGGTAIAGSAGSVAAPVLDLDDVLANPLEGQPDFETAPAHRPLYGKHILITAGPTHEPIDPVRYIANRSSGRQGFAIAGWAAALGARVTLVAGPVALSTPTGVERIDVETAREMQQAVRDALPADVAVMVAAVADWRVDHAADSKMKKQNGQVPALQLTENPDILASLSADDRRPGLVIGFAAETDNVIAYAQDKRKRKGADWIVANDVSGDVMGGARNSVHIITAGGVESWEDLPKGEVAKRLVERIADELV
ncbi:coenzyme A biosynthesis bifunctional protein CoaBC [Caenibius tardaugens NBRC 16725]|uniref:Coenzyme A biosynthesis bifunctional protein CoaBC n=1 Tax=Caenibius tardaugens NBRC 16725 TaxID=1219035 RepID=U2YKT7_9SPHN|nr:coenzyme A biosynthesis bifunctional protein CoaBC [Caenibius tardaugens NBRC 16725]